VLGLIIESPHKLSAGIRPALPGRSRRSRLPSLHHACAFLQPEAEISETLHTLGKVAVKVTSSPLLDGAISESEKPPAD
jgi:hypothetical protein